MRKIYRIKDLPEFKKPREKLEEKGEESLKDEELLAILLRSGYQGKNALQLARHILSRYGWKGLKEKPLKELMRIKGLGKAKATTIKALLELANRLNNERFSRPVLDSPRRVVDVVWDIAEKKKEYFLVLYLNARNELLSREEISVGTLEESLVHPREVFRPVFTLPASSLILVHNHPSGDPEPSNQDIIITRRLKEVADLIGVDILDHIIVSSGGYVSLKERRII